MAKINESNLLFYMLFTKNQALVKYYIRNYQTNSHLIGLRNPLYSR